MANEEQSSTLLAGSSKQVSPEQRARMKTAALIEEALEFLRFTARTNDYFTGYSLAEVITERLDLIGGKDDEADDFVTDGKRTLLSRLNFLQVRLIGEDGKSGAIGEALEAPSLADLAKNEDEDP